MITFPIGALCAFLSSCTWAIGSSSYSKMSRSYTPFQVNLTRVVFALPLFVLSVFITSGGWSAGLIEYSRLNEQHYRWFLLSVFASYALGDVLFLWSTLSLGVPGALAIASSFPIATALFEFFTGTDILKGVQWWGLVIAVSGIIAVILSDPKRIRGQPEETTAVKPWMRKKSFGIALAAITSLCWAVNGYSVARGGADIHPAVGNTIRMIFSIAAISILGPLVQKKVTTLLRFEDIRRYAWIFVIEGFAGAYLFLYGLSHTTIVLGNTLAALAPVLSVPVAVALRLEKFSWGRTLSVLTVVIGLSLLVR